MRTLRRMLLLTVVAISACGGGEKDDKGGDNILPSAVEGAWSGSSHASDIGGAAVAIVLDDGRYWLVENVIDFPTFGPVPQSVTIGSGSGAAGAFTSHQARQFDIGVHGAQDVEVHASYVESQNFSGTVDSAAGQLIGFVFDTFDPLYAQPFKLEEFDGLSSEGVAAVDDFVTHSTLSFSSGGAFAGALATSCGFHGTLIPRARGSAFELTVTVDAYQANPDEASPRDCTAAQYHGVAYPAGLTLLMIASDATGNALFLYIGNGQPR
jgi:hypothetical protein